jgi:crotonobetainyl-CoA:carnitine CoA-transferase CaiB-like acyl-CoA transferase
MTQQGALTGIRVLDLSRMLPGPYCSMILADHGADVIAIEDRKFQGDGLFFNDLNRNKNHMSLNLKTPEGLEIFFKLAEKADVILEGFRPGVVQRLGVGYEAVRQCNPGIIYCSISGYGQTGPLRNRVGHDVNYLSNAGVLDLIGEKGGRPVIPGVQIADIAGGSMNAAVGILLALFAREKTGKGQYIDISMTDGVVGLLSLPYYFSKLSGKKQQAADTLLSHRYGCYNTYETADGRFISIGAVENRFWKQLCEHVNRPNYISLQYDEKRREEIIQDFRGIFLMKSMGDWDSELAELEICFSVVKNLEEILVDPLFREREMVHSYTGENGEEKHGFGVPVKLSETPGTIRTTPGKFGEQTRKILEEIGYSTEQIDTFFSNGVL